MTKCVLLLVGATVVHDMVAGLVQSGYAVECVETGTDAIDRLDRRNTPYDAMVISSDIERSEQRQLANRVNVLKMGERFPIICLGKGIECTIGPEHCLVPEGELHRTLEATLLA